MYIYILYSISSQNTQLSIELTHQNITYEIDLILLIYKENNENSHLS